jgi:hypothetical protein
MRRHGGAHGGIAAADEIDEPTLEGRALEEDVAAAALAAQADVGAEAIDEPRVGAAGVGATEANDIAEVDRCGEGACHRAGE